MEIWKPVTMMNESADPPLGVIPTWSPTLGKEFNRYVGRLEKPHQSQLERETFRILSACIDPSVALTNPRRNAGLVLGYVQSGKTSSFTAATALAHDNGYKLIIVVAGVSNILLDQTSQRLQRDLELNESDVVNRWTTVLNPKRDAGPAVSQVQNLLLSHARTRREGLVAVGPTPIIVVMKQSIHLKNLNELLGGLAGPGKDLLRGISALIVDDECHMATPNVAQANEKSRIYELMGEMRSYLPHHSMLQYTATPQANLLCEVGDEFRSDFVRLLGHGPDYVGGDALFLRQPKGRSIMSIPAAEQALAKAAKESDKSVPSLRRAFATFLIIAANDYYEKLTNRTHQFERFSMLVHSDSSIGAHKVFQSWLTSIKGSWRNLLQDLPTSVDRVKLQREEFEPAFRDLQETCNQTLHPLDKLFGSPIEQVLQNLHIWLVDGSKEGTKKPDYNLSNYNIVNGGEMLGVGLSVPRLHVTHMLRGGGQGQMDTIQQRGRFFGYCGTWRDKIRVWLEDDVRRAFEGYVEEEEFLRRDLKEYDTNNRQLKDWKVRLRLNPDARPTRRNAIRRELQRFHTTGGWIEQEYWLANDQKKSANSSIVCDFLAGKGAFQLPTGPAPLLLSLVDQTLRGTEPLTQHHHATSTLGAVRCFLAAFNYDARDEVDFAVARETLDEVLSNQAAHGGDELVDVFVMAHGAAPQRRRRVLTDHRVDLFQGFSSKYCGDRAVHSSRVSLQIHVINHGPNDQKIDETEVAYVAVWLPDTARQWAENWIHQV
jgi:hypothetical protein